MDKLDNAQAEDYMEAMAKLMNNATKSPEGLKALAAAIAPPIDMEIKSREITSLLLTKHKLPPGEPAKYQKKPMLKAYWISKDGDAVESGITEDEVEFPIHRIHAMPMVDISVLKHGNVGTMLDIQKASADEIRKAIDKRSITLLSAGGNSHAGHGHALRYRRLRQHAGCAGRDHLRKSRTIIRHRR